MATTINTYFDRVKLLKADTLSAIETAINAFITGDDSGLEEGEHVTDINIDITSDPNAPWQPVYVATLSIVGSTTV
jgi:hypothetical protein